MSALGEWSSIIIAVAASAVVGIAQTGFSSLLKGRLKRKALVAANTDDFEDVLATGDLNGLGTILRDRLGSVPLETLLNDTDTQAKVYRSLQRLTEVVNQPAPIEVEIAPNASSSEVVVRTSTAKPYASSRSEPPSHPPFSSNETYIDLLDEQDRLNIADEIARITQNAREEMRKSDIWTGLAGARRRMEMKMLPLLGGSRKALSPRIFENAQFRGAMGAFLGIANKAIHGEEVSFEDAERALRAADFIAHNLPHAHINDNPSSPEGLFR